MQRKIPYILIFLVIFVILGEIFFLFFKNTLINKPPSSTPKTGISNSQIYTNMPSGYYFSSEDNSFYIFIAQADTVTKNSSGDIIANVSFQTNKGSGTDTQKQFLLSSKKFFFPYISLTKSKTFAISTPETDTKNFILDPIKNPSNTLSTLQKYTHQKVIFEFSTKILYPQKILSHFSNEQINTLEDLTSCNKSLLTALTLNSNIPSCTPYAQSIIVYDKNL